MLKYDNAIEPQRDTELVGRFKGLGGGPGQYRRYPCRMYKDGEDPISVEDTDAEDDARLNGYDLMAAGQMANRNLVNWFWDLEDLSAKQLLVFIKDEYDIDLPAEASQETLFQAVCKLTRAAPQNRNRIVLMAHTIKLNYDETLAEITRAMKHPAEGYEVENETQEFYA